MTLVWCVISIVLSRVSRKTVIDKKVSTFFPECQFKEHRKDAKKYADRVVCLGGRAGGWYSAVGCARNRFSTWCVGDFVAYSRWTCGELWFGGAKCRETGCCAGCRSGGGESVSLLIPCHRVIQKNGSVCNYGWGDVMKQKILSMEFNPDPKIPAYCKARRLFNQPTCRVECSTCRRGRSRSRGESVPVFLRCLKHNGMFADNVTTANNRKNQSRLCSCACVSVTVIDGFGGKLISRPSAADFPRARAVPDGASTFFRGGLR